MTDVVMTLLLTGSLAVLLPALDEAWLAAALADVRSSGFGAAGLLGGLAASTKYSAAAAAVSWPISGFHGSCVRDRRC